MGLLAAITFSGLNTLEADNTVRESKNQTMFKWLAFLLLQKGLELTGVLFHRVGHTHCQLGALLVADRTVLI